MAHYTYYFFNKKGERLEWSYGPEEFCINGKDMLDSYVFNVNVKGHMSWDMPLNTGFTSFWSAVRSLDNSLYTFVQERLEDYDLSWKDVLTGYEPVSWLQAMWWKVILPCPDEIVSSPFVCRYVRYDDGLNLHVLEATLGDEKLEVNQHGLVMRSSMTVEQTADMVNNMRAFLRVVDWDMVAANDTMAQVVSTWAVQWGAHPDDRLALCAHIDQCMQMQVPLEWQPLQSYAEGTLLL